MGDWLTPAPWRQAILGGWAVDGFLVVAPLAAVLPLLTFNLPVGAFLDAAVPGLFFGVAIGRVGCFLTGCCAGRISSSAGACGPRIAGSVLAGFLPNSWSRRRAW